MIAQPHSDAAKERAHTYGDNNIDQLPFFNSRVWEAITRIQQLYFKYLNKVNAQTGDEVEIEVRLYARAPAIPIYQLLNSKEHNILTRFGVFWRHTSSFKSPHIQLKGDRGSLIKIIRDHYQAVWDDYPKKEESEVSGEGKEKLTPEDEKSDEQDFALLFSRRGTIAIDLENDNITKLREQFEKAQQVSFLFPKPSKDRPNYRYFKCFYFKPYESESSFCLRFNESNLTVRVSRSNQKSVYQGVAIRQHHSYAMFMIGSNKGANQRIMTLNIPVGSGSLDKEQHFGIYSNTDINNGSPYSQLILLHQITEEVYNDSEAYQEVDKLDLNQYLPYLKDRRISLPPPLWNRPQLMVDKTEGDYRQSFKAKEHETYFKLLSKELNQAISNIYFLGYPPSSDYTGEEAKIVKEYYDGHESLMKRSVIGVSIHRIILDPYSIRGEFLAYLEKMFSYNLNSEGNAVGYKRFSLFVSEKRIPLESDLILIDPDTSMSSSISSFLRKRLTAPGKIPIRLEVIKENKNILQHQLNFWLEVKAMDGVNEYFDFKELQKFLRKIGLDV